MTPAARVAAAIELLAGLEQSGRAADQQLGFYFRKRRYVGAKDRRAVTDLVYRAIRGRARIDWWLERLGQPAQEEGAARRRLLAALLLFEGLTAEEALARFDGSRYGPAAPSEAERALAAALAESRPDSPQPCPSVGSELPDWLYQRIDPAEHAALQEEAPLDLRVNSLKAGREVVRAELAAAGIDAEPTPWSPLGLRLRGRQALPALPAFREGRIEVQDEGSQLVALVTGAEPGMTVADLCAGAGGKTLALAAAMADQGRIVALDRDPARLRRARPRLARAGVGCVELVSLATAGESWLETAAGGFERVLLDAPCSGSGAWRRSPDARWRLTPEILAGYLEAQRSLLLEAARLVRPGGRLVYATCSLLREENDDQVDWLLAQGTDLRPLRADRVWQERLGTECPAPGPRLRLSPARHGTDGFFVALFERAG